LNNINIEKDVISIGKIVGVHGINGNLKVNTDPDNFPFLTVNVAILLRSANGREKTFSIKWAKPHKRIILLSLNGIESIESAEVLVGSKVFINKSVLPELEGGSYYWFDIIGLEVYTKDEYIGRIDSIIDTGSNDVYVVKKSFKEENKELLIPAIKSVVLNIDYEKKTMLVELPEGL